MLGILVRFRTLIGQGGIAKDTFTQKHKQPPIFNKRDRILMRGGVHILSACSDRNGAKDGICAVYSGTFCLTTGMLIVQLAPHTANKRTKTNRTYNRVFSASDMLAGALPV